MAVLLVPRLVKMILSFPGASSQGSYGKAEALSRAYPSAGALNRAAK